VLSPPVHVGEFDGVERARHLVLAEGVHEAAVLDVLEPTGEAFNANEKRHRFDHVVTTLTIRLDNVNAWIDESLRHLQHMPSIDSVRNHGGETVFALIHFGKVAHGAHHTSAMRQFWVSIRDDGHEPGLLALRALVVSDLVPQRHRHVDHVVLRQAALIVFVGVGLVPVPDLLWLESEDDFFERI